MRTVNLNLVSYVSYCSNQAKVHPVVPRGRRIGTNQHFCTKHCRLSSYRTTHQTHISCCANDTTTFFLINLLQLDTIIDTVRNTAMSTHFVIAKKKTIVVNVCYIALKFQRLATSNLAHFYYSTQSIVINLPAQNACLNLTSD